MENIVIDPQVKMLMESAALGMAAKEFMACDFGKHIVSKASAEVDQALSELIECPPGDAEQIRSIQNRVHVAQSAVRWLVEAINEGDNAMRDLDEEN